MTELRIIHSEVEIEKDIIKNFKQHRIVNQTAFYLGEGASHYYNPNKKFSSQAYDYSKIVEILENIIASRKEAKIAFISLGCGSCEKDKMVLEHLQELGYDLPFFGVDSSMAMIKKARHVLKDVTFKTHLICADFGEDSFAEDIVSLIGNYDIGIYLFFGNTFGNLNQSYITDVLSKILRKGDYLMLDIVGFNSVTHEIQLRMFQRYLQYIKNPTDVNFRLQPLKTLGIPDDCGKLTLEVNTDGATQARVFRFGFKINELTKINLKKSEVNLSPNEHIGLIYILVYDLGKVTKFLEERGFSLRQKLTGDHLNQLFLQKQ